MTKLRDTTLLFLIKKNNGQITDVCLAMKKKGFGQGRFNGVGGKVEAGETIEQTVIRETQEEIGVTPKNIIKVAEFYFCFPHNQDWNQTVHFYQTEDWDGEPTESDEMKPEWFKSDNLPFAKMWPDDFYWMPYFLRGEKIKGFFKFAEGDVILEKEIKVVEGWGG